MDQLLVRSGKANSNVEIGKFTALILATANYVDGVDVAATSNAGPLAGIAQESLLPQGFADYSGGVYQIISNTAWPAGAIPSTVLGRNISFMVAGVTRAVAATAINVGQELNVAGALSAAAMGALKPVSESTGTLVYVVGQSITSASTAKDVIRVQMNLYRRAIGSNGGGQ